MNAMSGVTVDRRSERTQMFLVATLYSGRSATAVRVRNMSETGALVEGADLPASGATILLRRGALEVPGTAVWATNGKAGLTFGEPVCVSAWLPTRESKRQTQIDEVAFKHNQAGRSLGPARAPARDPETSGVIAELMTLEAQLRRLDEQLALDVDLLAKHPGVQILDVAAQRVGQIIATLVASTD